MNTWYIGVCVRESGHAAVRKPTTSLDECLADMRAYCAKHAGNVLATTYMTHKGDEDEYGLLNAFGHPKSRDLMQDKAFIKEITR